MRRERPRRAPARPPPPRRAAPRTGRRAPGPFTMRWLRGFSLACSLLAAALLPGPREAPAAAAAAAFESGLGFSSDAEPDAGEAKVGAGRALRAGLLGGPRGSGR